ncbi:TetR/AcrR family transcriptional regulator [Gordonia rhizosphera]|uniref:TetR/AcrR family transcriptional regulator n=1 Tax=Gordonia rhizosphera TaxID=83341 RepID=UPI00058EB64C|nr:TetR/AcrR family transcriptional regulator [Gordonia rhizosphera]
MSASTSTTTTSTRTALLAAAESLFLADGYDQVSVRAICAAAQANPAAVHYHFGSKDQLTVALLEERLAPLWADPLDRFDPACHRVADLVNTVVAPFVTIQGDPRGRLHLQLLSRFALSHPRAGWTQPWFRLERWSTLLVELVPGLSTEDARRRWSLAFALILAGFGGEHPLSAPSVDALSQFVVAGLGTPARTGPQTQS